MSTAPDIVIVGAGLAGTRCAHELRKLGHDGRILLVGDEPHAPYERPPLSKEFLAGTRTADELVLPGAAPASLDEADIERLTDVGVRALRAGTIELSDGTQVSWQRLVLATGARARQLGDVAPAAATRVSTLRTLDDAARLREHLQPGRRLVIVGSGFVGAEVASTARTLGVHVTLLEAEPVPFARAFGDSVGIWLEGHWRSAGVDLRTGAMVAGIDAAEDGVVVRLTSGELVAADHVLVAIGTIPNDELYHDALSVLGIEPGSRTARAGAGIPVDSFGRTAIPGVWAAGDVAATMIEGGDARRVEHWTDTAASAQRVARDVLGVAQRPVAAPYAWSDQFGMRIQVAGAIRDARRPEIEVLDSHELLVRYYDADDALVAVLGVGHPAEVARTRSSLATA